MPMIILEWQADNRIHRREMAMGNPSQVIRLGRDPNLCDVVFSDPTVSGLQAEIAWDGQGVYLRCLRESNPPWVDGQRLGSTPVPLKSGSVVRLGRTQIKVISVGATPADSTDLSLSQLIPVLGSGQALAHKAHLVPAAVTVIGVIILFSTIGNPTLFNACLAFLLGIGGFYFIYQLCGKSKPWWAMVLVGLMTVILLVSPVWSLFVLIFREILPGNLNASSQSFTVQFTSHFFGAGLLEELLKALPIFLFWGLGMLLPLRARSRIGVVEPLDGIIYGAASALGFTWLETMGEYVPGIVEEVGQQAGTVAGELVGLQLLIPRILGSVAGHMAYSGYFGYGIGLAALKPKYAWLVIPSAYLGASVVHALWNASDTIGIWAAAVVGILAYVMLSAAILKARQLSPNRHENFATSLVNKTRP
ncbi:PrsW family glutamic-type intramembrane protease [Synechococcus sp. C9]|uniref:PrsW family glutamic-type intramembrane protease n=1 Tax=Synechococcus sp. C9 TaxID=102119 RepID=UPI001FF425E6|nr:PrsW family glutamic-type intramembrane protease [Synechococcus sp. C9]